MNSFKHRLFNGLNKSFYGILLVALLLITGCDFGTTSRYYFLDIVNSGADPVEVSVSLAKGSWTVAPGESKTVKIENQTDNDVKTARVFSMKSKGETKTAEGKLGSYAGHIVLDVTGNSCIVAADYGAQFRGKEISLPEGKSDIEVLKVFKNQQVFVPTTWNAEKAESDFIVMYGLGEKLPESIKTSKGNTGIPKLVRLIRVPCEILDDKAALYNFLNHN